MIDGGSASVRARVSTSTDMACIAACRLGLAQLRRKNEKIPVLLPRDETRKNTLNFRNQIVEMCVCVYVRVVLFAHFGIIVRPFLARALGLVSRF